MKAKRLAFAKLLPYVFSAALIGTISSCSKNNDVQIAGSNVPAKSQSVQATGKYDNGFFLINEGWYAHGTGTVSYFDNGTGVLSDSIFTKENPGKNLNPTTCTLQYGTIFNDKLYLVTKVGGPFVVVNPHTMQEINRIAAKSTNDFRAFVGIDANNGFISSNTGIFPVNLQTLALGTKLAGISGQVGDMIKAGNYVFALSASSGVLVIDVTTNTVVKTISGMLCAFARTPDGAVWAAGGTQLVRIDPTSLATQIITIPFQIFGSWAAWHPGSITASTTENAVYIAKNLASSGGSQIYKYTASNSASFTTPLVTLPAGRVLYGSGIAYNPANNQLVVTTVHEGFTTNFSFNELVFYNSNTGAQINDIAYVGYYFPSIAVFH